MKFCEDLAFQSVAASPRAFLAVLPLGQSHGQRKAVLDVDDQKEPEDAAFGKRTRTSSKPPVKRHV